MQSLFIRFLFLSFRPLGRFGSRSLGGLLAPDLRHIPGERCVRRSTLPHPLLDLLESAHKVRYEVMDNLGDETCEVTCAHLCPNVEGDRVPIDDAYPLFT